MKNIYITISSILICIFSASAHADLGDCREQYNKSMQSQKDLNIMYGCIAGTLRANHDRLDAIERASQKRLEIVERTSRERQEIIERTNQEKRDAIEQAIREKTNGVDRALRVNQSNSVELPIQQIENITAKCIQFENPVHFENCFIGEIGF